MAGMTWDFTVQLERYGPDREAPPSSAAEAWQYCRWVAHTHYENFSVASLLLPRRLLRHFHAVYAYCRWADDLADEAGDPARATALLAWWRKQLLACYRGEARHPVFVALGQTIRTFGIPPEPFLALLAAFEQDQRVHSYATFDDLLGYCVNSANPVGRLVLYLLEAHDDERGRLSDDICTALQLANFWQDVARDLDLGRVYLPVEDRVRFGYPDDDLHALRFTPAFASLLRFEVDRTRDLFFRGYPLVDLVPAEARADIELFIEGGLAILKKIEKVGYNVLDRRPALAKWEKGMLVAGALWRRVRGLVQVG
ncbi:MAG: squalene synthase HpnC [Gemmataceae bacterium]